MTRRIVALLLCTVAGCAVGPDYHRPTVATPAAFRGTQLQEAQAASYADLPWWQVFADPQLQELILSGLAPAA